MIWSAGGSALSPVKTRSYRVRARAFQSVASLRYLDTFVKTHDGWLFAERNLILDWSETRPSTP